MKNQILDSLTQEYKNSFCSCEGSTIEHLKDFVEHTNSSELPSAIKERLSNTALKDIKAISSLMDLQIDEAEERSRELKHNESD